MGTDAGTTDAGTTRTTPAEVVVLWRVSTVMTGWCVTCGTDVEFTAPAGFTPVDLAADERACVWCGEALVVSVGLAAGHDVVPDRRLDARAV